MDVLYENENTLLQNKINLLENAMENEIKEIGFGKNNIIQLFSHLIQKNTEIQNTIVRTEKENKDIQQTLNHKVIILEKENKELKEKVVVSENKIVKLEYVIVNMKLKELKHKLITSITDLNGKDKLEHKLKIPFNGLIRKLREKRNGVNHYIDNNDTDELCNRKKKALLVHLQQLSDEEKTYMNKYFKHTEFIDLIISYLESLNIVVEDDEEEDEEVNEWWE